MKQCQKSACFAICCLFIAQVYSQEFPCDVDYEFNRHTKLCTACVDNSVSLGGITSCTCKKGTSSLYSEPLPPVLRTKLTGYDGFQSRMFGSSVVVGAVIYLIPRTSKYVGMYNPVTNTLSKIYMEGKINRHILHGVEVESTTGQFDISNQEKYSGAVYAPKTGNIYLIPFGIGLVGVIDTAVHTFSTIISEACRWHQYNGGVLSQDGNFIYMVPSRSAHVGVIDVNSHAFTSISASIPRAMTFQGGVLTGNGDVYFCPDQRKIIGVLEPKYQRYSTISVEHIVSDWDFKNTRDYFSGCVLHTDGMIYFLPGESESIYKLDPSTRVFSKLLNLRNFIDPGKNEAFYNASGWGGDRKTNKFSGGVSIGPDKIYLIPSNTRNIGLLTLYPTLTFELITDVGVGDRGYKGGVELFGEIYMTSANKNQLDVIDLNLPILSSCTIIPTTPPITTPPTTIPPLVAPSTTTPPTTTPPLVAPPTTTPPLVAPPTTTPPPQAPPPSPTRGPLVGGSWATTLGLGEGLKNDSAYYIISYS